VSQGIRPDAECYVTEHEARVVGGGTTALCLSTNISFIFSMEPNGRSREVITPGVAEVVVAGH
jgi:hypothetical protein